MWPFSRPIEELTEGDLRSLVGLRETPFLEFKAAMYAKRDPNAKVEMLRDVSSIANAEGGVLVIGMAEDGDARATAIEPVPEARAEGDRLIQTCLSGLKDRVAGLRAQVVAVPGGDVLVVYVPRSYRRPHMVVAENANELWIRHERQKSRMTIDEIRGAIAASEDLEMKAERFVQQRRDHLHENAGRFAVTVTPLTLEAGRIDVHSPEVKTLLRDTDATDGHGQIFLTEGNIGRPSLGGRRVDVKSDTRVDTRLEVFRNGHVEFCLRVKELLMFNPDVAESNYGVRNVLASHKVAEHAFRVVLFAHRLHLLETMADPLLVSVSLWGVHGFKLEDGTAEPSRSMPWAEGPVLEPEPVVVASDEVPDERLRKLLEPLWNAFGHERFLWLKDGKFQRPNPGPTVPK